MVLKETDGIEYQKGKIKSLIPSNENNPAIRIGDWIDDVDTISHILFDSTQDVYVVLAARAENGTGRHLHAIVEKDSVHKVIFFDPWEK